MTSYFNKTLQSALDVDCAVKKSLFNQDKQQYEDASTAISEKIKDIQKIMTIEDDILKNLQGSRTWLMEFLTLMISSQAFENCLTLDDVKSMCLVCVIIIV